MQILLDAGNAQSMQFLVGSINRFFEYISDSNLDLSKLKGFWVGSFRPPNIPNGNFKVRQLQSIENGFSRNKTRESEENSSEGNGSHKSFWAFYGHFGVKTRSNVFQTLLLQTLLVGSNFGRKGQLTLNFDTEFRHWIDPEFRHCSVKTCFFYLYEHAHIRTWNVSCFESG